MQKDIINQVKLMTNYLTLPDNNYCKVISSRNVILISKKLKVSSLSVEIIAVKNKIMPERYIRNMQSISFTEQLKLLKSSVCVVGLGGLGGMVIENLARVGIGCLRLIDGDVFEDSNLNRQLLSSPQEVGNLKVNTAKQHISKINPSINVITFDEYLSKKNSDSIINECQVTVDCLDNIKSRFILEHQSKKNNIPMVSAAIAGTMGHLTTIFPKDIGLELIFGKKINLTKNKGEEIKLGCISYAVNAIASMECSEIVKVILGKKVLKNKLLILDLESYSLEILNLI